MTTLKKIVRRVTCRPETRVGHRQLIVMLEPGDLLAMKEYGRRTVYRTSLDKVFSFLAKLYAAEQSRKKAKEKAEKRRLRLAGVIK